LWVSGARSVETQGRPIGLFVTAGQVSDDIGARALPSSIPNVDWRLGDRGSDADRFQDALKDKGIRAIIPGRKQRKTTREIRQTPIQTAQPD